MRNAGRFLPIMVVLFITAPTVAGPPPTFFDFVNDQANRRYAEVPHQVIAVYYAWYGRPDRPGWGVIDADKHTISNTAHYPVGGPYSSHDREQIDRQIDQAKAHGITAFAVSWWGTGEWESWIDQAIPTLLDEAEKKDFKIAIYYEQAPGEGRGLIDRAIGELSHVLKNYGTRKAFLKVDDKPVILAYSRVMGQVPLSAWPEIISRTREKAGDFVLLADGYQESYPNLFDGLHTYGLDGDPSVDAPEKLRAWSKSFYAKASELTRSRNRINCVLVHPGYDIRKNSPGVFNDRRNGMRYRTLWENAIKSEPDWILITSWNEWYEGSELEPSVEFGDKYLEMTTAYAKRFLESPTVKPPAPTTLPTIVAAGNRRIGDLLTKRRVGFMLHGGSHDPEFWLNYCGADVHMLTWEDLVDPDQFTAKKLPALVYAGGEIYKSTINSPGDVVESLKRYLRQGGMLVVLPNQPFPFYYDESNAGRPAHITDQLQMGIEQGWDTPPENVAMHFQIDTKFLPGLPAGVPFPTTGDLRYRPSSQARVPEDDQYIPLAHLKSAGGQDFGEGISFVQHRSPPLAPGKTLYAWMRMADVLGPEHFYPALFEFAATKMQE